MDLVFILCYTELNGHNLLFLIFAEFGGDYQDDSDVNQKDPRETLIDMIKEENGKTGIDYQDTSKTYTIIRKMNFH